MDTSVYEACNDLVTEFKTHKVSPDEILAQKVNHLVPIPFKSREDIEQDTSKDKEDGLFQGDVVPRMDLKILHYFATQLCLLKYPHLINTMDETCMITLGLLVEQWIEEYLTSIHSDSDEEKSSSDDDDDDSDSESHSDSEAETQNTRPKKKLKVSIGKGPSELVSKVVNYRDSPTDI